MGSTDTVRKFFQAINDNDPDTAAAQVTDDAKFTELPTGRTYQGPGGVRENFAFWLGAFPDGKVEVTNIIEAGDKGRGRVQGPRHEHRADDDRAGRDAADGKIGHARVL